MHRESRKELLKSVLRDDHRLLVPGKTVPIGHDSKKDPNSTGKNLLKRVLGKNYGSFVRILSPLMPRVLSRDGWNAQRRIIRQAAGGGQLVVQLGSGTSRLHPAIINCDLFPFAETDLIADCLQLPIRDSSVDLVFSNALLEHVSDPELAVREQWRILKPGGRMIATIPFLQPFHGSPDDYSRWTRHGLLQIFYRAGFNDVRVMAECGPTSTLLWIVQEYLCLVFSLGNKKAYSVMWWLILPILAPFKLIDIILVHHPLAHRLASTFTVVAQRRIN